MVLVTGGTGLLGSHLIYHLLSRGKEIRALRRSNSSLELISKVFDFYSDDAEQLLSKVEWFEADLMDIYAIDEAMKGIHDVYHAAAIVSFDPKVRDEMMDVNVNGTALLVNAAIEHKVRKFCHVSSIASIGRAEKGKQLDEKVVWKASGRNSMYAISKYGAEREVWRGIEEGLNAVIVNPSVIIGPGDKNNGTGKLISLVWKGLKFYTSGINGFVDVRDVVESMILLMENDVSAERFIVSAENMSYKQLFQLIADNLNVSPPRFEAKKWMGKLVWRIEMVKSKLFNTKPVITKETARTARNKYYYSSKKLIEALNFNFMTIENSVNDSCQLFLKEGRERS